MLSDQPNSSPPLVNPSIVPLAHSFANVKFSTIGQEPGLLKRMTTPDPYRYQSDSPTPPPPDPGPSLLPQPSTITTDSSRMTLAETLADGNSSANGKAPVDQGQDVPVNGAIPASNVPPSPSVPHSLTRVPELRMSANAFSARPALQQLLNHLRSFIPSLTVSSSPMSSATIESHRTTLSQALRNVHDAASEANASFLSAQAAHFHAQQSLQASQQLLALAQQTLTAAQTAHSTAEQSLKDAEVSLGTAREARERAEELRRLIATADAAIRPQALDFHEERVHEFVARVEALVDGAEREERVKQEEWVSTRKSVKERRMLEMATERRAAEAEVEADIARKAWDLNESRALDETRNNGNGMPVDQDPGDDMPVKIKRKPVTDKLQRLNIPAANVDPSYRQKADEIRCDVNQSPKQPHGSAPLRSEEAETAEEARARKREEELRKDQEKMREQIKIQKSRSTAEAAAKINEAKEKKAAGKTAVGNPMAHRVVLPSSQDTQVISKTKPISGRVKSGSGNSAPSGSPSSPTVSLPSTLGPQPTATNPRGLLKKPLDSTNADHGFVRAATDVGRRVDTHMPFSSLALASDSREDVASVSTKSVPQSFPQPKSPVLSRRNPSPQDVSSSKDDGIALFSRPIRSPTPEDRIIVPSLLPTKRGGSEVDDVEMTHSARELVIGAIPPASSYAEQASNLRHLAGASGMKIQPDTIREVKKESDDSDPVLFPVRKPNNTDLIPHIATLPNEPDSSPLVPPTLRDARRRDGNVHRKESHSAPVKGHRNDVATGAKGLVDTISNAYKANDTALNRTRRGNDPLDVRHATDAPPLQGLDGLDRRQGPFDQSSNPRARPQISNSREHGSPPGEHVERDESGRSGSPGGDRFRRTIRRSPTPIPYLPSGPRRNRRSFTPPPPNRSTHVGRRRAFDHYSPPRNGFSSPPSPTTSSRKRPREDNSYSEQPHHPRRHARLDEVDPKRIRTAQGQESSENVWNMPGSPTTPPPPTLANRLQTVPSSRGDSYRPLYDNVDEENFANSEAQDVEDNPELSTYHSSIEHEYHNKSTPAQVSRAKSPPPDLLYRMSDQAPKKNDQALGVTPRMLGNHRKQSERGRGGTSRARTGASQNLRSRIT